MTDTTIYNPMLDDDDEEQPIAVNPMLDDDETPTAPVRPTLPRTPLLRPTPTSREPKFGEKGFGKGKPHPHKGSPRSFVTPVDAPYLAFLNEVQVADATTLSLVNTLRPPTCRSEDRPRPSVPRPAG